MKKVEFGKQQYYDMKEWMNSVDIADLMLYILNSPKVIEVSERIIDSKAV